MKTENMTIEEAILNLSKKVVCKRKSQIMFFTIFAAFSIAGIIFIPGLRVDVIAKGPDAINNMAIISTILTVAAMSLLFMIIPVVFEFRTKAEELIAAFDKALKNYVTEMKITRSCREELLQKLKNSPHKNAETNNEIARLENDIQRINNHLETISKNYLLIKKHTADLALAS